MTIKDRIIHAILFEAVALCIIVPAASMLSGTEATSMLAVGVGLSIYTVIWNYFYNIWFDKQFGGDRINRTLKMRIGHTCGFEAGLIFITVPAIAWFLGITLLQALALEAVFLVFFFFYAVAFNWCYDNIKSRLKMAS
ncbi:transmembrane pair domain protein [Shewanella halifaxensis HAW-EB4]|uniref:Transmembrane pair domain protein n=1 Tax=Shewanella halifaxensis (strain HAW-EB4) TaxID=458817 RepID=B0TJW4_SHEHH|nr:PACE efflux transporter [Shewanella halifaxensis]ABZ75751.1 transmembrane pair domain protein [Shewanella halifaxensis HAW-EB4]